MIKFWLSMSKGLALVKPKMLNSGTDLHVPLSFPFSSGFCQAAPKVASKARKHRQRKGGIGGGRLLSAQDCVLGIASGRLWGLKARVENWTSVAFLILLGHVAATLDK